MNVYVMCKKETRKTETEIGWRSDLGNQKEEIDECTESQEGEVEMGNIGFGAGVEGIRYVIM